MKTIISICTTVLLSALLFQAVALAADNTPANPTPDPVKNVVDKTKNITRNLTTPPNDNNVRPFGTDTSNYNTDNTGINANTDGNGMNAYDTNNVNRPITTRGVNDTTTATDWGWLGLIGLVGLAGLWGRGRDPEADR